MVRQINLDDFDGWALIWWTARQWRHTIGCLISVGLCAVVTYMCYLDVSANGGRMLEKFSVPPSIWHWLLIISSILIALFLPGCKDELKRTRNQWQIIRVARELNRQLKRANDISR